MSTADWLNTCKGVSFHLSRLHTLLLRLSAAYLTAYDHSVDVIAEFHRWWAWIIIGLARSCSDRIFCSVRPFWWCAFTPANVRTCPSSMQSSFHSFAANIPLSACQCLTYISCAFANASNAFLDWTALTAVWLLIMYFFLFLFPTFFAESLPIRLLVDSVSTRVKYVWFPFWAINSYESFTLLVYVVFCIMHISLVRSGLNDVLMVLIIILEFIWLFQWLSCILYWRLRF